jgi:hypothetical protein
MAKKNFPERVQTAIEAWEKYTRPMRECRKRMLAHYANGWFDGGGRNRTAQPVNLIDRGVQIIAPFLVSRNPKAMIFPRGGINNANVKPFAKTLELASSHLFDEIKLAENTLRPIAIDSLFSAGITKTGVAHSHQVEIGGYLHDVGQPYCDRVDFDDYIGDVAARNRQEMKLEGNRYRLPLSYIRESGLYKNHDKLTSDVKLYGDTSPETIGKPAAPLGEFYELHRTVELHDVWLPKDGVVITLAPAGQGNKILRTVEWDGPEGGPYDIVAYRYFPNSVIPIPPVYVWMDLNKTINQLVVKMKKQSLREKNIGVYQTASSDDAEKLKHAGDGELVGVVDPNAINELHFGGFNEQSFPFLMYLEQQYSIILLRAVLTYIPLGARGHKPRPLGRSR